MKRKNCDIIVGWPSLKGLCSICDSPANWITDAPLAANWKLVHGHNEHEHRAAVPQTAGFSLGLDPRTTPQTQAIHALANAYYYHYYYYSQHADKQLSVVCHAPIKQDWGLSTITEESARVHNTFWVIWHFWVFSWLNSQNSFKMINMQLLPLRWTVSVLRHVAPKR